MARRISEHCDFDELLRRMTTLTAHVGAVRGVVFRCCEPAYATKDDLLTGKGSQQFGGRWNPPASFATVYAAFSDTTAPSEAKANHVYYGFDPADALPRTIVAVDIKLATIVDLTNGKLRKALGLSAARMRGDDWRKSNRRGAESLTQAIGRAAYASGIEGLIVPACDNGRNVVWFPGNLLTTSKAIIRHVSKL